jgi:transcriptional regulator with XRE-family HTH domain
MPEDKMMARLALRLRTARQRHDLTQKELAKLSGVSYSLVSKLEQGVVEGVRLEKVRLLAVALRMTTSDLIGDAGDSDEHSERPRTNLWGPTHQALLGQYPELDDEPSLDGVQRGLADLRPLLASSRYASVAALMPNLIRDAEALDGTGRGVQARVLNAAAWLFTQTRQFAVAESTARRAIDVAADRLDAAAAVKTLTWAYLRQGRLDETRTLATRWADDIEPRLSRATTLELTVWGQLLLFISSAAIRDNRPGEADDSISLARAAAARIGHEVLSDTSTARTFGPVTVAMVRAENAAIEGKPDKMLAISDRIPMTNLLHANAAGRNRHRLEMASAYVATRRADEALAVLADLGGTAPEWLSAQRYAHDILARIAQRRRTFTPQMRQVADLVGLAY